MKRTFHPAFGSRAVTIVAPIIIFGVFALFPLLGGVLPVGRRSAVPLNEAARAVVGGLLIAIGVGLAIRNALVGITYARDVVTIVNGFRTVRIPTGQVRRFRWTEQGLAVEWQDAAGQPQRTTVDAFHKERNPMAKLARGQEVHRELEALHAGSWYSDQP